VIEQQTTALADVFAALDRGATVVTGNNRLAAATRRAFDLAVLGKGLEAWPTPDILPWTTWLQNNVDELILSGAITGPEILLSGTQEQCIWEAILTETMADQPLQQPVGTVRQVQEAWRLLHAWQLPLEAGLFAYNDDSKAFYQWARLFEARCRKQQWLSSAQLAAELQRCLPWDRPDELLLLGFDELIPQQQALLAALAETGCQVQWLALTAIGSRSAVRTGCDDIRQEAATMARWVRQRLQEDPTAMIGVVVPELAMHRAMLVHALDEVLVPEALLPGQHSVTRPYNISLGAPLSSYPIISTALRLLDLLQPAISLEDAGRLLAAPFIAGWEQEAGARALLDGRLRQTGELRVASSTLYYHASQPDRPYACPYLTKQLDAWFKLARDCPHTAGTGQWSERFTVLLQAIGWSGGRSLSSEEYQAVEAWRELLGTFAALEPVTKPLSAAAAAGLLRRMAGERTFQPQTGAAPVQVLGMLEAGGLRFGHLWIMGLHDGAWPAAPRPNPFIPLPVQRRTNMPRADEMRELQVARTITSRLLASAAHVVVSFPQRNADEILRPSPLITDLPAMDILTPGLWSTPTWREQVHQSAGLIPLRDDPAPPLEQEAVSGGSAVFKLQAACPFRAFAELRLGARALGQADIGLDAMTRGALMHRVLEKVWQALDSHEQLQAKPAGQLEVLVKTVVEAAIAEIAGRHPQTFSGRFREMEAERLCRHLLEWLELEQQRQPFRVVEKEAKHEASAGGIRVQVKIDRIDALDDNRQVLIDYKTGTVKPAQWFGERPDEPQLPLYSLAAGGDIAALMFAQVKAGHMAFNGVAAGEGLAPGVQPYTRLKQTRAAGSWAEVLETWRTTLEHLGEAFRNGEAAVDPKHYAATCQYCDLTPLCRINELTVLDGDEIDGAEDNDA
jgi:probable DNA repair protein